jgi:hypothetical protein
MIGEDGGAYVSFGSGPPSASGNEALKNRADQLIDAHYLAGSRGLLQLVVRIIDPFVMPPWFAMSFALCAARANMGINVG